LRPAEVPAAASARSALSVLVDLPPISFRSVMPAGGANLRRPVVPKKVTVEVGAVAATAAGAVIAVTLLWTCPLWSATGVVGSVPP
jgi:hypothetical protein